MRAESQPHPERAKRESPSHPERAQRVEGLADPTTVAIPDAVPVGPTTVTVPPAASPSGAARTLPAARPAVAPRSAPVGPTPVPRALPPLRPREDDDDTSPASDLAEMERGADARRDRPTRASRRAPDADRRQALLAVLTAAVLVPLSAAGAFAVWRFWPGDPEPDPSPTPTPRIAATPRPTIRRKPTPRPTKKKPTPTPRRR